MGKISRKGTPEQFKALVEQKIQDLSSCDKINKEEIKGGEDCINCSDRAEEVKQGYKDLGYDITDPVVQMMMQDTEDYLNMGPDDYTFEDWYRDTEQNYPEYLDPEYFRYEDDVEGCIKGCIEKTFGGTNSANVITDEPDTVEAAENDETVADWLSEHDQAYEDALEHFDVDDLNDVSEEGLIDWISEHDQLYEDYKNYFNIYDDEDEEESSADEKYVYELEQDLQYTEIPGLSPVVEDVDIDDDGETIFISVTFVDDNGEISINDYEIPWEDLTGEKSDDIDYITSEIYNDIEEFE